MLLRVRAASGSSTAILRVRTSRSLLQVKSRHTKRPVRRLRSRSRSRSIAGSRISRSSCSSGRAGSGGRILIRQSLQSSDGHFGGFRGEGCDAAVV
jgi:hypothetical protein